MSSVYSLSTALAEIDGLIARAEAGEEIVIVRDGIRIARLGPIEAVPLTIHVPSNTFAVDPSGRRSPGNRLGLTFVDHGFDNPLPDDIQRAFEGLDD